MELDSVQVNSKVDTNGNGYTTAVSADKLTNNDFLNLMIQELKMQDPTKPMDSASMMDNQLKMSTIESNIGMSESMDSLRKSYESSTLGSASQMMGKYAQMQTTITDEDGVSQTQVKQYLINTISQVDGVLYGNVNELLGLRDNLVAEDGTPFDYNENGFIYEDGVRTDLRIKLEDGRFALTEDGAMQFINADGEAVTDEDILNKYFRSSPSMIYGEQSTIPLESIQEISNTVM